MRMFFDSPLCRRPKSVNPLTPRLMPGVKSATLNRILTMVTAPVIGTGEVEPGTQNNTERWLKILLFSAIVIYVYGRVAVDLAVDWWTIPSQSQGLLIPPLALYIAWER